MMKRAIKIQKHNTKIDTYPNVFGHKLIIFWVSINGFGIYWRRKSELAFFKVPGYRFSVFLIELPN
jgi:hypothetical protein